MAKVEPIFAESVIMEPVDDSVYPGATKAEACGIQVGLGRIVTLYHHSSASYWIC